MNFKVTPGKPSQKSPLPPALFSAGNENSVGNWSFDIIDCKDLQCSLSPPSPVSTETYCTRHDCIFCIWRLRDAPGTVCTQERHAELGRPAGIQSGDLRLEEEMPLFLCATPNDFNPGEPCHDHLDSQGYELHNYISLLQPMIFPPSSMKVATRQDMCFRDGGLKSCLDLSPLVYLFQFSPLNAE
ncbi:unnamed protein product [Caretta caretta]